MYYANDPKDTNANLNVMMQMILKIQMQISTCYYAKASYKDEKDSFIFCCPKFIQIGALWCPKLKFSKNSLFFESMTLFGCLKSRFFISIFILIILYYSIMAFLPQKKINSHWFQNP